MVEVYRCATTGYAFVLTDADPADALKRDRLRPVALFLDTKAEALRLEPAGAPTGVVFSVPADRVVATALWAVGPDHWEPTHHEAYAALTAAEARENAKHEAEWRAEQDAEVEREAERMEDAAWRESLGYDDGDRCSPVGADDDAHVPEDDDNPF